MFKYFAVKGKTPKGQSFRGVVAVRGEEMTIERGPKPLARKPWHADRKRPTDIKANLDKVAGRPLLMVELEMFSKVHPASRPCLTASLREQMENKFREEENMDELVRRGTLLEVLDRAQAAA